MLRHSVLFWSSMLDPYFFFFPVLNLLRRFQRILELLLLYRGNLDLGATN